MVKQIGRGDLTLIDFNDVTASFTAPSNPSEGAMWFNKNDNQLYVYETNGWTLSTKGMEFGGRNLLRGSALMSGYSFGTDGGGVRTSLSEGDIYFDRLTTTLNGYWTLKSFSESRISGDTYTVSFDYRTEASVKMYFYPSENYSSWQLPSSEGKWKRASFTYTQTGADKATSIGVLFGFHSFSDFTKHLDVRRIKLEKGNVSSDWSPAPEDADEFFEDIMETLGNMANDNLLDYQERKVIDTKLLEITGTAIADTVTTLPTTAVLDAGLKGDFYSIRKSALNAGLPTNDTKYIDVATKYNALATYLNAMTPKPWDLSVANKDKTISVVKATFKSHWLNYFTAVNNLATATAEKLKKNVDDIVIGGANLARNGNFGTMLADSAWSASYVGGVKEIVDISTQTPPFQYALHINNTVNGNGGIFAPLLWSGATAEALVDKEVTISFWLKYQNIVQGAAVFNLGRFGELSVEGLTSTGAKAYTYNRVDTNNTTVSTPSTNYISGSDNVWKKYTVTHKLSLPWTTTKLSNINFKLGLEGCRGEFWMTGLQIEMGNKASEWKYSDEDMNQRVTNAEFKVSDSQIISSVTSSQAWTLETAKIKNSTDSIADMMSDLKITPIEKSSLKTLWDEMQAKYTQMLALANTTSIAVSATALTAAYNAMNTTAPRIQLDILASMTTTYTLTAATRDAFKAQVNTFYVEAEKLNKAISDKINAVANEAKTVVTDIMSDLKITPVEKAELQRTWQKIQAQYTELNAQAITLGVALATRTNFTAAYNALNTTTPRIQTDILASMSTNYTLTTATRDTFKAQLNTYFTQAEIISRANTDSIQSYASRIEQKADGITTTVTGINTRLGQAESKISQTAESIALKVWSNDISKAVSDSKSINYGYKHYEKVIVYGDSTSLYYPVVIKGGDQDVKRDILIKRGYSEQAPVDWNTSTHKGGLTVKLKTNFGGWGGANYSWEVHELEEMYSKTFGGALQCGNSTMFALFLRGGGTTGAVYHIYSDQPLNSSVYSGGASNIPNSPQIAYTTDLIFQSGTYLAYAPAPRAYTQAVIDEIAVRNFIKLGQNVNTRLASAELSITPEAITGVVKSSTSWVEQTSAINKVQSNLNNLKIGGRNLVLNSKKPMKIVKTVTGTQQLLLDTAYVLQALSEQRVQYTVTVRCRGKGTNPIFKPYFSGTYELGSFSITEDYAVYTNTISVGDLQTTAIHLYGINVAELEVDWIKIEKGNKASDWTPAIEDVDALIVTAQKEAEKATKAIADMSSDGIISPVEKVQLKKEWAVMVAEKVQLDGLATTFGITAEKGTLHTAYTTLNTVLTGIFANMATNSTVTGSTFRGQFDDYYDKKAILQRKVSETARTLANGAQATANTANSTANTLRDTTIPALVSRVNSAEQKITPEGIVGTVKSSTEWTTQTLAIGTAQTVANTAKNTADTVQGKLDNLQIGGRNLLKKSDRFIKGVGSTGITSSLDTDGSIKVVSLAGNGNWFTGFVVTYDGLEDSFVEDEEVTVSFVAKSTDPKPLHIYLKDGMGGYLRTATSMKNQYSQVSVTTKWKKATSVVFHLGFSGIVGTTNLLKMKVEKGNIATDWTPAPEDVDELISTAQKDASDANSLLTDIMSDLKITPVEKSTLKLTWDEIQAKHTQLTGLASTLSVATTTYLPAFTALNTTAPRIQTDILASMTATYTLTAATRDSFKAQMNTYFVEAEKLGKAITDKVQANASAAQTAANNAQTAANTAIANAKTANDLVGDMASDMKVTALEKNSLKITWDAMKAEYAQLVLSANALGVSRTALDSAYNGIVTTVPRIETDVLASMTTTYIFTTTALRDAFKAQFNTYYLQSEALGKAIRDKIQANAQAAQVSANTANQAITDMSSDGIITPVEKVQLQKEWAVIKAEKISLDGTATTFGITTEKTNLNTAYTTLNTVLTGIFTNMKANSTVTAATFRGQFDDFYDKKAILQRKVSETARTIGIDAQSTADNIKVGGRNLFKNSDFSQNLPKWTLSGTGSFGSLESDSIYGKVLKTSKQYNYRDASIVGGLVKKGEDITVSFFVKGSIAHSVNVRLTDGSVLRALSNNQSVSITTQWKKVEYVIQALFDADGTQGVYVYGSGVDDKILYISNIKVEKGNRATDWTPAPEDVDTLIATAQAEAEKATKAISDMSSDGIITPVEKVQLKKEWAVIVAEKVQFDGLATTFGITTEKTNLHTAYTTLNTTLTTIFANMNINSTVAGSTFRNTFDDYYDKKAILQRKVSETARGLANTAQTTADNIKIGGRNLLISSNDIKKNWMGSGATLTQTGEVIRGDSRGTTNPSWPRIMHTSTKDIIFDTSSQYTLSFDARANVNKSISYGIVDGGGVESIMSGVSPIKTTWDKIIHTFTPNRAQSTYQMNLQMYVGATTGDMTSWAEFKNFKLEKGNRMTDWTPAPEDIDALINTAQTDATNANNALADISSDLKITPVEKSTLKTTWDEIQAKNTSIVTLANSLGVSTSAYAPTFTALNTTAPRIQTDILANMTTTYTLTTATRDNLKSQMNTYYVQYEALSKAISDKINGNAGAAQSGVNDLVSDLKITPLEKSELSRTWEIIKAQYGQLNPQATSLGVDTTLRTAYTAAYNALNTNTPRIQTDILAVMTTTYTLTIATRDAFKAQMITYQTKAQEISKAITDKLDVNTKSVQSNVDAVIASTGNLVNNPSVTGNADGWSSATMSTQTFQGVATKVLQNVSTASTQIVSNYFDVDPSKAYEVSMWVKKSQPTPAAENFYLGTNQQSDTGAGIAMGQVSNSTGSLGTDSTNFYFLGKNGTANFPDWEKLTAYILPSGFNHTTAKGIGNVTTHGIMKANTKKVAIRFLNWSNTTTVAGTTWVAHPKVVEVPTELISKVSSAESQISQLANDITSKVSKTDYTGNTITSMINQTATTIKLKAENIELLGITTVAQTLYIGGTWKDSNFKSIEFRGDSGGAAITSSSIDSIEVFGVANATMMGLGFTALGADYVASGSGVQLVTSRDTEVHGRERLSLYGGNDEFKMVGDGMITMNGEPISLTGEKVLWSGAVWLNASHTITPKKSLAQCPNGWILLWSRFVNGAESQSDWNVTVVPKQYPQVSSGAGMWCALPATGSSNDGPPPVSYKYIYPRATQLLGHARNGTGTETGQVLRYVIAF